MVSIQIWVTRFHIRCTGELEQVCLAAAAGSLFFSTGLESDVKYAGYDKRRFCPERFCGEMTPRRRPLPMSSRSPQLSPGAAEPEEIWARTDIERKPPGSS